MLDLFSLNNEKEDIFPESWIGFEGEKLGLIKKELVSDILSSDTHSTKYSICKHISSRANLCLNGVWNYLKNENYTVVPVLNELIELWREKTRKSELEVSQLKKKLMINVDKLKVNNSACKKVNAQADLNEKLAYLAGAHAADGMINLHLTFSSRSRKLLIEFKKELETFLPNKINNNIYLDKHKKMFNLGISLDSTTNLDLSNFLSSNKRVLSRDIRLKREYRWKIVDLHFEPVKKLKEDLNVLFGIDLKIKKEGAAWKLETKNKILVRYLNSFFNCPYGKKSRIIDEPSLIKNSKISHRSAFLRGVFTFDGSLNRDRTIKLETYSYKLFNSIIEILSKKSIDFTKCKTKRGSFQIQSSGDIKKWLFVFEKGTEKWKKMQFFANKDGGVKVKNVDSFIKSMSRIYPNTGGSKLNLEQMLQISKTLDCYDLNEFSNFLLENWNLKVTNHVLLRNLEILEICNVLRKEKKNKYFVRKRGKMKGTKGAVVKNTFQFNPNVEEWRIPY